MGKPEKLLASGTQDKDKNNTHNTICVGNHYTQINTNNIRHEPSYKQLEVRTNQTLLLLQIIHDDTMCRKQAMICCSDGQFGSPDVVS